MVGASAPQSQPSAEEEALKRNTDCVYFLASPLTCKKGSECEYRHSDIARVNPRDCWYWLNGNCLNPKCAFRHPPLDGLLGPQMPTSAGTAQPILQTATTPSTQVASATSKPGVPCKFFQSGFCIKGDWCPFLHAPNSTKNKVPPVPVSASAIEPSNIKKVEMVLQEKKVPPTNIGKPMKESSDLQAAREVEPAFRRNELSIEKKIPYTSGISKLPDYNNGDLVSLSNRFYQPQSLDEPGMINNKDAGDVSREPSPGFDVLVDDEVRDPDIYHREDRYGMSREYEARNEFDIDHFADYNMIGGDNNDRHLEYESNRYGTGQNGSDQNRASSERSSFLKRRPHARDNNRGQIDELDLRYRLARNKQPNGLRSVISHEHARDKHVEDRNLRETSLSSRLRGRIRLSERSSSPIERGTEYGGLSPVRARPSSNQGRILDRMKGRVEEASSSGWKNHRGLHSRRDMIGDNNADFAGPRSLAELKNRKNSGPRVMIDREQLGKRKYSVLDGHQQNGDDLNVSFEGPKPLEEILKRKRGDISGNGSNNNPPSNGDIMEVSDSQKEGKDEANNVSIERTEAEEKETALEPVDSKVEGEIIKSGVDQESEVYEEREEFDSEQDGGEDYDLYEGDDNGEGEGEYVEDEDDDDDEEFAKKMGVVYS